MEALAIVTNVILIIWIMLGCVAWFETGQRLRAVEARLTWLEDRAARLRVVK